ncbi:MAG TPA: hydantoinase/oxoprolinase family protein, partial [Ktedonobacterales bacterium]|nr:hydantoinase/oxoprolinase family protein [Ktedonobacterales bacterium]
EIEERTRADGTILQAPREEDVRALIPLWRAAGVQAVAVVLLHSYRNTENERAIAQIIQQDAPELTVSLSSAVVPQIGEYERTSTTVLNAYTQVIAEPYLQALSQWLSEEGFPGRALVMLSSGGVAAPSVAGRFPVRMIESGPAAGVLAAVHFAKALDEQRLLSFDMGGTTAKACFIEGYQPLITTQFEAARVYRFKPGSGLPVAIPSVDLIEIGAGGGSIARRDALNLLRVGPDSAGADPGPACYCLGGDAPTVTDADLVLGYLDEASFLGGEMRLSKARAEEAFGPLVAALGISVREVAEGVHQLVNEDMAAAVREHAVERGIDYRGIPILAFGGAGPVHACHVAELLESASVIFPRAASVLSAYGSLLTPVRMDLVRSALSTLNSMDWELARSLFAEMSAEGEQALTEAGVASSQMRWQASADMRYAGQQCLVTVPLPGRAPTVASIPSIVATFEREYEQIYGVRVADIVPEVVNWRLTVSGAAGESAPESAQSRGSDGPTHPQRERTVFFDGRAHSAAVYARHLLRPGQTVSGPALVEERETTIVLRPGWRARVDQMGNLVAQREVNGDGQ